MAKKNNEMPECCKPKKGIKAGLLSGIIPHSGCIAIILLALIGVTAANSFFIEFLSNKYYFIIIFAVSFFIASIAAFLYIRRFPDKRIKSHWRYLTALYSSVILINLVMIYVIFPAVARIGNENIQGSSIKLDFTRLPCSGHISLVQSELEKVEGIKKVNYVSGSLFEVYYDPNKISKKEIIGQEVCKEFKAEEKQNV